MIIYESTLESFNDSVDQGTIAKEIEDRFVEAMGHKTTLGEMRAWKNSMRAMRIVLSDIAIPSNAGVAIEFKIPYSSKRVDFIISGRSEDQRNTAIIVELKQWESAETVSGKDAIVRTFVGGGMRDVAHPSYQAWSYAMYIEDFNENVQNHEISIKPCAYLHNYALKNPDPLTNQMYQEYIEKAPVFTECDVIQLSAFIKRHIKYGDDKETLVMIENGRLRPSKSLQDAVKNMILANQERDEFVMIDEQKVVYESAILDALTAFQDKEKRVLIVSGGPGTGKSVVAINLLVYLLNKKLLTCYVSKNAAPRNVFAAMLAGTLKKTRINNLFKGSGTFVDSKNNEFDALIVDEAHRLNQKGGIFHNIGENQIKEIIHASKFSLFFIDESQRIDAQDIGSIEEIMKWAELEKAQVSVLELESQFRCNGSDGYLAWLDDVLEIRETANADGFEMDYDIQVLDHPDVLKGLIADKNLLKNKARLVAGYCWNWVSKKNDYVNDIIVGDNGHMISMQWNFANTSTFAIDPDSVNQIGCIHTTQGLEFEYVGVIIGLDLRFEDGKIITDYSKRAATDKSLNGLKGKIKNKHNNPIEAVEAEKKADEIIRNTYRTLMTRGQKGCYIYCVDHKLGEYLRKRIALIKKY